MTLVVIGGIGGIIGTDIGIGDGLIQPHSSMIERWLYCQRCRFKSYCGLISLIWDIYNISIR